jgi:CelD/BcsL family acetyltransferase involved in cellulose biosynthesis
MAHLGPEWDPVFDAGPGLQSRRAWFQATEQAAMPKGAVAHIVTVQDGPRKLALLPLLVLASGQATSLTSPYTLLFQPLLAPGADPFQVGRALGRVLRRWPLIRLEALDPEWTGLLPLLAGLRKAWLVASRFDHFGNWTEDVAGLDWPTYLAARPGALRETIRRRGRAVERDGSIRFEITSSQDGLQRAIGAYEQVYARSWKVPEPYPRFNQVLLPMAADLGVLRMALMWQGDTPLAAQYWTVVDGVATVLKLAHDDGAKALSPGTVLTAHVIRRLLEQERVTMLDFGRGDDPYKQLWTTVRHQRVGVLLTNPFRRAGLMELIRHRLGRGRRALLGQEGSDLDGRMNWPGPLPI